MTNFVIKKEQQESNKSVYITLKTNYSFYANKNKD
jgi:hypothetical protein